MHRCFFVLAAARRRNCTAQKHWMILTVEWEMLFQSNLFTMAEQFTIEMGQSLLKCNLWEICSRQHSVLCLECWAKFVSSRQACLAPPTVDTIMEQGHFTYKQGYLVCRHSLEVNFICSLHQCFPPLGTQDTRLRSRFNL